MSASRTERLLALALVLLNTTRPLSRSEIRAAVRDYPSGGTQEAFERMFERDKDELRSMGLPIESVPIDDAEGVGYLLVHGEAFLPPIDATESERFALALASRMWQEATWSHAATTGLRKLELVGGFDANADLAFNISVQVDSAALTSLLTASRDARVVRFDYRTASGADPQPRELQPWGVVAARGQWYVVGHDVDRDATRAFRLSRIVGKVSIAKAAGSYDIPTDVDLRELVLSAFPVTPTAEVVARLAPGRAARLRHLATSTDGDVATFADSDPSAMRVELLRAGPDVEVLEPATLRHEIRECLDRLATAKPRELIDHERAALKAAEAKAHSNPIESSTEQLGRLLALVPWLRAHPGVTYEQAAQHFGVDVARLHKDLELAVCTEFGSNLLTLDIDAWGSTIHVRDPQGIMAPLRFTEAEGFSLLVGLDLLAQIPGPHDLSAVASVSDKLREAVGNVAGLTDRLTVEPSIPTSDPKLAVYREELQAALLDKRAVDLTYLSFGRDAVTRRVVDPMGLLTTSGVTYLQAWCRSAEAVRLFRLDRIQELETLTEPSSVPQNAGALVSAIDPSGEVAICEIEPSIAWWADHVPHDAAVTTESGTVLVQLRISSHEWAIRTALGFGGRLVVLTPNTLATAVRERADAALARYPE